MVLHKPTGGKAEGDPSPGSSDEEDEESEDEEESDEEEDGEGGHDEDEASVDSTQKVYNEEWVYGKEKFDEAVEREKAEKKQRIRAEIAAKVLAAKTPQDCRYELQPRTPFSAVFEDVLLAMELIPGVGDKGAVVSRWTDAIANHDAIVVQLEEAMMEQRTLVKKYKQAARTLRNWQMVWGFLNENPQELEDYLELKFLMKNYEQKYKRAVNPAEKIDLEEQWERFCRLAKKFEKVIEARDELHNITDEKDTAHRLLLVHENTVVKLRDKEREGAEKITEDHIRACELNIPIGDSFPSIFRGYIVSRLLPGGRKLEKLPFLEVLKELAEAPRPMHVEFLRYDLRLNEMTGAWQTLEELRWRGQYVPDPRFEREWFIQACVEGHVDDIMRKLERGEDVNCRDGQGCTGLHHAAARGDTQVIALLLSERADLEARNGNMETPLMWAVQRGNTSSVRHLLECGAKLNAMDRMKRPALVQAILRKQVDMCSLLLLYSPNLRGEEQQWGWTALHCATHAGLRDVAKVLLDKGASLYSLSHTGQTPLDVARACRHVGCVELLEEKLLEEPAHRVIFELKEEEEVEEKGGGRAPLAGGGGRRGFGMDFAFGEDARSNVLEEVWIGNLKAGFPQWATAQAFDTVITLKLEEGPMPRSLSWLLDDEDVKHYRVEDVVIPSAAAQAESHPVPSPSASPNATVGAGSRRRAQKKALAEQRAAAKLKRDAWDVISEHLRAIMDVLHPAMRKGHKVLIQCDDGRSSSVAVLAAYRLLRQGVHITHTLKQCAERRPGVALGHEVAAGLQRLQDTFLERKNMKLEKRTRNSPILSIGF